MWFVEVNEQSRRMAALMLYQAGIKDCDCEVPCNCLEINFISMDVDRTEIRTANKTHVLTTKVMPTCKACNRQNLKVTKVGCSWCGCEKCGHSMLWDGGFHGICRNCHHETLSHLCKRSVGHKVRYKGTNGNEYDRENHGKPVEGEGQCLEYHDSHGMCILVKTSFGTVCVDPTEVEIL